MATKKYSLTEKQSRLLLFLHQEMDNGLIAPSYRQMAEACEVSSTSGINRLIKALEERGHLRRIPNRARAIELL